MAKNNMRLKEYEYAVIADTIDQLMANCDNVLIDVDNYTQQYEETHDEWYSQQAEYKRMHLEAYTNIITYLEKYR